MAVLTILNENKTFKDGEEIRERENGCGGHYGLVLTSDQLIPASPENGVAVT